MKDYSLMFVVIDYLIDEVKMLEETYVLTHTFN